MVMPITLPTPAAPIAGEGTQPMSHVWQEKMQDILLEMHKAFTPPRAIIACSLSAAQITAEFSSGKGKTGGPYEWWAICNGSNGTPDLSDKFIRHNSDGGGAAGGSLETATTADTQPTQGGATFNGARKTHTHSFEPPFHELVYLMRLG